MIQYEESLFLIIKKLSFTLIFLFFPLKIETISFIISCNIWEFLH